MEAVAFRENGQMRGAGFEPHVENVVFLTPLRNAAGAFHSGRKQLLGGMRVPGVGAFAFEKRQHMAQRCKILELRSASIAIKHNQRHTPESLPRDAPVGTLGDHLAHAIASPRRKPFYLVDFFERFLAEASLTEADEPLLGG